MGSEQLDPLKETCCTPYRVTVGYRGVNIRCYCVQNLAVTVVCEDVLQSGIGA